MCRISQGGAMYKLISTNKESPQLKSTVRFELLRFQLLNFQTRSLAQNNTEDAVHIGGSITYNYVTI